MIFRFSRDFVSSIQPNQVSDLVSEIVSHDHFLEVTKGVLDLLNAAIEGHASTTQRELFRLFQGFSPSSEIKTHLTTINVEQYSYADLLLIASKPAVLLMENTREWDVYKSMIYNYSSDRFLGNIFKLLRASIRSSINPRLIAQKAGGFGEVKQSLSDLEQIGYNKSFLKEKVCIVFDRDTDSSSEYDPGKKSLFVLLCGKDNTTVNESDIYTLSQPVFIWHMWYRRAIENYFPDEIFEKCGFPRNPGKRPFSSDPYADVREYFLNKTTKESAIKNALKDFSDRMTREMYEHGLQSFTVNSITVSEIQLFLLKLVKII